MKTLALISTLLISISSFASASFSAFSADGIVYITTLTGSCNTHTGSLNPIPFCKQSRSTKNLAPFCKANFEIKSTTRYCIHNFSKPQVFSFGIDESDIALESETLEIDFNGEIVEIKLNR